MGDYPASGRLYAANINCYGNNEKKKSSNRNDLFFPWHVEEVERGWDSKRRMRKGGEHLSTRCGVVVCPSVQPWITFKEIAVGHSYSFHSFPRKLFSSPLLWSGNFGTHMLCLAFKLFCLTIMLWLLVLLLLSPQKPDNFKTVQIIMGLLTWDWTDRSYSSEPFGERMLGNHGYTTIKL